MENKRWMAVSAAVVLLVAVAGLVVFTGSNVDGDTQAGGDVRDCGTFEAGQQPGAEVEGFECAAAAFAAGEPARLEISSPTDEGALVMHNYEIDGPVIQVSTDMSQDPLSDGGVYWSECSRWDIDTVAGYLRPQDCEEVAEPLS